MDEEKNEQYHLNGQGNQDGRDDQNGQEDQNGYQDETLALVVSGKKQATGADEALRAVAPNNLYRRNASVLRGSAVGDVGALRRARLNRLLMRRRRHQREGRGPSRYLMIAAIVAVVAIVSFLSSGVGAAYAYYRAQLPLLNGVANHTLFQTTHIYDRNGKLLYELYDPQYGRRTYVNYTDIAPVIDRKSTRLNSSH